MTRIDTPKRAKEREQGWGAINTATAFIAAYCVIRYGFHHTPNPIPLVVGVSIPGAVKAWIYRRPRRPHNDQRPTANTYAPIDSEQANG